MASDSPNGGISYAAFETLDLTLGKGADTFTVDSTHPGTTTIHANDGADNLVVETIAGTTNIQGGAGNDTITVNLDTANPSTANGLTAVLNLDGQGGADLYVIWAFGNGNSLINVHDTGAANDGADKLTLNGTPDNDQFLVRANFLAVLHDALAGGRFGSAERINYDASLDAGIELNGLVGDDNFASDDNATTTTLNGGIGKDTFQIGQVFQTDRLPPNVAAGDQVQTTLTTVGYLTNGASFELTANGDAGDDRFVVFRNLAKVTLKGGDDNDTFVVRAFALASTGQVDPNQQGTTVNGGADADVVQYAVNAQVDIDGGDGLDKIIVLGTEFGDTFVITDHAISGAGLYITYAGVETLELHAGAGNDTVYVVSTPAGMTTTVFGGPGSDHVYVGKLPPSADPRHELPPSASILTGIRGPLFVEGASGDDSVFNLPDTVMLPAESDDPAPGQQPVTTPPDSAADVDVLDVDDTNAIANDQGVLTGSNLSGLGMGGDLTLDGQVFAGGITYHNLEIIDIALGSGDETLAIQSVAPNAITLVRGNAGNDTFNITAPASAGSMLVVYGDNAASTTFRSTGGNDTIDASASSLAATFYGGPGNDTILGSLADDRIAAGSGNDAIDAGPGNDLVFGDSGFDVNRDTRLTTLVTAGQPALDNFDAPGNDRIESGSGNDIVFGDHGLITQVGGTAGLLAEQGIVRTAETTNQTRGGNDTLLDSAGGNDLLFGGQGSDDISAGAGNDFVVGDNGIADYTAGNLAVLVTTQPDLGAADTISGGDGDDVILAGAANDTARGDAGNDLLLGDHGKVEFLLDANPATVDRAQSTDPNLGGNDTLAGDAGQDILFGGTGSDTITGGADNDVILGDHGLVDRTVPTGVLYTPIFRGPADGGGNDTIFGDAGNDLLIGSTASDAISGGDGNDLIFGDHARIEGNVDLSQLPLNAPVDPFTFTSIDTQNTQGGASDTLGGDSGDDILIGGQGGDLLSGGEGDDDLIGGHNVPGGHDTGDRIDGNSGNDVIAGDNASVVRTGTMLSRRVRTLTGSTLYDAAGNPLVGAAAQNDPAGHPERSITLFDHSFTPLPNTSGDDDIAGGAGDDMIFGQLGNDALQGDGSTSLNVWAGNASAEDFAGAGSDGDDYIEGNGGNDLIFGDLGQDDLIGGSSDLYSLATRDLRPDGRDRIFGGAGTRTGRFDSGDTSTRGHARDADVILGDNGDIFRLVDVKGAFLRFNYDNYDAGLRIIPRAFRLLDYTPGGNGQAANAHADAANDLGAADLLVGEGGDDIVHGQTGNDVIFGNGQDDDLYGGAGHDRIYGGNGEDGILGDDGNIQTSRNGLVEPLNGLVSPNAQISINPNGPFVGSVEFIAGRLLKTASLTPLTAGGNDIIYGGLGDDFIHGGAGNDAISGSEALPEFYNTADNTNTDPLRYDPATRKLAAYDANNPLTKISGFLLNFQAADAAGAKIDDGKDRLFGDDGHDWLVGGTGKDRMFGGNGDDLLNGDDNQDTNNGLNNSPDAPAFADGDFAFGGLGLDVLIANTGNDRLYDWKGEFNSFLVPFSAFGAPTVNRAASPAIIDFLRDLGRASGADQSFADATGELGLDKSGDNGGPRDPQPGNIGGSQRDTQGAPEDDSQLPAPNPAIAPPAGAPLAITAQLSTAPAASAPAWSLLQPSAEPILDGLFADQASRSLWF
jgi:Ca2+-binding RTX toxin-like protein